MNHELPNGWQETTLGEVVAYASTNKVEPEDIGNNTWVLELEDIEKSSSRLLDKVRFSDRKSKSTKNLFKKGDVLYGKLRPYLDKVIIANEDGVCTTEIIPLQSGEFLDNRFLFYNLKRREFLDYVEDASHGVNMPRLGTKQGKEAPFVLAPLSEQIRIADKLDRILARVNAVQARLDKIPALIKRFRQSVLAAATSGELTQEWRDNDSRKNEFLTWEFSNIPGSWEVYLLPEISESRLGKMLDKNKNQGIPVRYLGNINVRWGKFDLENLKEILVSEKEKNELTIEDGDLLVCEGGEPGRSAVWRDGESNLTFQKALHRIRFGSQVVPEYGFYSLQNDYLGNRLMTLYTGTTIKHLTGKALNKYPLAVPPLNEQHEIVRRVESLFALADTVEKQYQDAKSRTDRLSQAILAKAFRGELVSQNPDDEPAEALLQRIQQQRKEQKSVRNRKGSGKGKGNTKTSTEASQTIKVAAMTLSEAPKKYLLTLLKDMGGTAEASALWKKSGLSIDDFYASLKQETAIQDDNASADPSQRKLKIRQ